jgi:RNA polymerase sigma-70 factor (ECF subfamily)
MGSPPDPEPELLEAVRAADAEAIDRWFRAEHPRVWKLCLGFLADGAEADDVAQDAMLRLLDTLGSYDPTRPYGAWRDAVVLNSCRDRARRTAARVRAEERAAGERLPAVLPDPEHLAAGAELREALTAALGALSPREREAFVLCELEGTPTAEAARVLGVGESSVRSLLALARRRLRGLLAPRLGIGDPERGSVGGGAHA